MAFFIVSAFCCKEEAVACSFGIACHADLCIFEPVSACQRFALLLADDVLIHKELIQGGGEVAVYSILETLVLLCHERGEFHHCRISYQFAVLIEDARTWVHFGRGVGKVYKIIATDMHPVDVLCHITQERRIEDIYLVPRYFSQQIQKLQGVAGRSAPIGRPFITGAVFVVHAKKEVCGFHKFPYAPADALRIRFYQHQGL